MKLIRLICMLPMWGAVALLSSCGGGPGIETLSKPVSRTSGVALDFDGKNFSSSSRQVLKEFGLERQAKRDPAEAIRRLDRELEESGRSDVRLAAAEVALNEVCRHEGTGTAEEFGYLLCAIRLSEGGLAIPQSLLLADLVAVYNEANAELAWLLHQHASSGQAVEARGPIQTGTVAWADRSRETMRPEFYDTLTPTSRIKVKGFDQVNIRHGIGGSLVGYREATEARRTDAPFMPHTGFGISVTTTLDRTRPGEARVVLHDLIKEETVVVSGRRYPLAADFTAAVATVANSAPGPAAGWMGMLRPTKEADLEGLYTIGPYRRDLIPLVLVHGLMSTPETWREVINLCYSDPVIRENYQVLTFYYPTGYPMPQNAATLRAGLKAFQQRYDPDRSNPAMRRMVMVGHSMGANLTNFQIRDGGEEVWKAFFDKPPEEITDDPVLREEIKSRVFFEANPDIARVVFVCGPHRGSPLSDGWLGRFGAMLIRFPMHALDSVSGNLLTDTTVLGRSVFDEYPSSINNLEANSPILDTLLKQPVPHDPNIHSIIGDQGKEPGVGSTDGVVPYWSSHLDGVDSEYFIPAKHTTATNNAENVREVRRILYKHLGKTVPKGSVTP